MPDLASLNKAELVALAQDANVPGAASMTKSELRAALNPPASVPGPSGSPADLRRKRTRRRG